MILFTLQNPKKTQVLPAAQPLTTSKKARQRYKLPEGVSYHIRAKRYVARTYTDGKVTWVGSFKTVDEASAALKLAKSPISLPNEDTLLPEAFITRIRAANYFPQRKPKAPTQEQIATLAYQFYVARGYLDGYSEQDWQNAERQLTEKGGI